MSVTNDILDMKSVKGEYLRLLSLEILKAVSATVDRMNGKNDVSIEDIVSRCAINCYSITNADFEEPNEESR